MVTLLRCMTTLLFLFLGVLPLVSSHGSEEVTDSNLDISDGMDGGDQLDMAESYFSHIQYASLGYAHIALMVISWVFVLPVAIMLSLARSRYTFASQLVFLIVHTLGLVSGTVYHTKTPDLYPSNAHHGLGWVATWLVVAHVLVGLIQRAACPVRGTCKGSTEQKDGELQSFIPRTTSSVTEYQRIHQHNPSFATPHRHSHDSGHGTEQSPESVRSNSVSTTPGDDASDLESARKRFVADDDGDDVLDDVDLLGETQVRWRRYLYFPSKLAGRLPAGILKAFSVWYHVIDRTILPFGFVSLCTGIATYGRFFEGSSIYSGLAHWIKGGVFFWMGILTLGRWAGSFGDLGWAWNVPPKRANGKWRPSAEIVESALIFTYGATNIFLEHLGGWGGEWTSQDLEHISITVLFIGGGLCGMLVESVRVRNLLNSTVVASATTRMTAHPDSLPVHYEKEEDLAAPGQYGLSLNPLPALVIVLLGFMMSSHMQHSMLSGMVHKQWGNLLLGASLARCLTYLLVFLKPPTSVLPSRPPTELLAAFGLISGGIIFMASSSDTIAGMENYHLNAMFFYTITMGLVGVLMAWVLLVLALKGWAVRWEAVRRCPGRN